MLVVAGQAGVVGLQPAHQHQALASLTRLP
jgi:hypothetical protein